MKFTKYAYENYLNDLGIPLVEFKSNGGRIPDGTVAYGQWLRINDPIAFNVGFQEYKTHRDKNQSHVISYRLNRLSALGRWEA